MLSGQGRTLVCCAVSVSADLYVLCKPCLASTDSNPDGRGSLAVKQDIASGSSDGSQLGVACSQPSQVLVCLHQLEALAPVHVGQGSSGCPAHACSTVLSV